MKPFIIITAITVAPGAIMAFVGDQIGHKLMMQSGTALFAMFFLVTPIYLILSKKGGKDVR